MSIFDTVLNAVQRQMSEGAAPAGNGADMMTTVLGLVNSPELGGGLSGLVEKFSQGGLSEQVASWVGNGENQPVNGTQIQNILGLPVVQNFAEKLGINTHDAAQHLATILPQVVDKLTPNGEVSNDNSFAKLGMSLMSSLMGNKTT
jgi:uncharacterized protein YidB (DUF937 family)